MTSQLLNVPEAAALLGVSEKTIYRNIKQRNIPVYRVGEQYRFNRAELLAWATSRRLNVPEALFHESLACNIPLPSLGEALRSGGIHYRMEGADKESVLRSLADNALLSQPVDRYYLFRLLLAREALGSTSVGEGVAVPQLIYPNSLDLGRKSVTLIFLEKPIDYDAVDGQPVSCLIGLFSATLRGYYHLQTRVQLALRDSGFRQALAEQYGREEIMRELARIESTLRNPAGVS